MDVGKTTHKLLEDASAHLFRQLLDDCPFVGVVLDALGKCYTIALFNHQVKVRWMLDDIVKLHNVLVGSNLGEEVNFSFDTLSNVQ